MKNVLFSFLMLSMVMSSFGLEVTFIDMEKIFDNYYKTKDADAALKTQRDAIKDLADNMVKELEEMSKSYMQLREDAQNVVLSKEQRDAKFKEMQQVQKNAEVKKKELDQYQKGSIKKIRSQYEKVRDDITKELMNYLSKLAKLKRYDLVLDVSGKTSNGISGVVYYNREKDITDAVLKSLNAGHENTETEKK